MKSKLIQKFITAVAVAGSLLAVSSNSYAQSGSDAPAQRPAEPADTSPAKSTPVATSTEPAIRTPPATGSVYVGTGPAPVTTVLPLGEPGSGGNTGSLTPAQPGDRGIVAPPPSDGRGTINPQEPITRTPPSSGGVTYVGQPATTPLARGTQVPPSLPAANSGVVVISGDIARAAPGQGTPPPVTGEATAVLTLVQQFDMQRTQELAARNATLEQLRTATPDQRTAIIADMQAAAQQQAAEQREAARELRRDLRSMREERKGK